ncbi:MAG: aminoglycoside phosphotransferase family protein [Acholeplasmataceae bacterium]
MLQANDFLHGYKIISYLGSGKSADSYLVQKHERLFVLKKMHLRPFLNGHTFTIKDELSSYDTLLKLGLNIPKLISYDEGEQYLIKAYVEGADLASMIKDNNIPINLYMAFHMTISNIEKSGYTIDYFPTNFIVKDHKLYYVDYEINPYDEVWNFKNWGVHFWFNTKGFNHYFPDHNMEYLTDPNHPGHPIKSLTKASVENFYHLMDTYGFLHLCHTLNLDIKNLVIHQKQHGMAATSFEIKDDLKRYFVKFYPTSSNLESIKSEIKASSDPVSLSPKLVYSDLTLKKHQYYVLVFEYIEGEVLMDYYTKASLDEQHKLVQTFTKTLIHIHSHKSRGLTYDFISDEMNQIKQIAQNNQITGLQKVFEYLDNHKQKVSQYPLTRLHGDYHPWNIMISNEKLYVIDWMYKTGDFRFDVYWTYTLLLRSNFSELAHDFLNLYQQIIPDVKNDQSYFILLSSTRWLVNVLSSLSDKSIEQDQLGMFKYFIDAYITQVSNELHIKLTIDF